MKSSLLIGALLLSLSVVSARAQDRDETVAAVNKPAGEVRTSRAGAEFTPAAPGQRLEQGDRILVGQDSKVTLRFDNNCDLTFDEPGVYTVDNRCVAGALWGDAAKIGAGVAVAGLLLNNMKTTPGPAVSR
ncbi:MAG: hypothetical protein QM769_04875 [Pseudoxanthomonas sp.]